MPLSDVTCRTSKPKDKDYKLTDERGLSILVTTRGSKLWRLNYRFDGKYKTLALGIYPDVGLKQARELRDAARQLVAAGVDPSAHRKDTRVSQAKSLKDSFESVAREWHVLRAAGWTQSHSDKVLARLEQNVFPHIGRRPISQIRAPELLSVIRYIEVRGAIDTAHRTLQNCGQVFRYAIATGFAETNPVPNLKGALAPAVTTHHAAITEPKRVGQLLRACDSYDGAAVVRGALRLGPLVFVRPGELRLAAWDEMDLERGEWNIPAARMKTREAHLVPLSKQAVAILGELYSSGKGSEYVFPSVRTNRKPISNNTVLAALRRLGYSKDEMTGHGFRAMARTMLDEVLQIQPDYIEHQLAHAVRDPNGRAYNRTKHLAERRLMMQAWADYLDHLKAR